MKIKRLINVIKLLNQLERKFPTDDFLIMNPKWNKGFNYKTGKKIKLVEVEIENEEGD